VVGLAVALESALLLAAPGSRAAAPVPAWGERGMVVSSVGLADQAGRAMFERGGNAVDAAVATAFAAGVVNPFSSGIGGGGFILVHVGATGEVLALDAREVAPAAARPEQYVDASGEVSREASRSGGRAVAVPSLVPALLEVHARFGALPLEVVMEPAIRLCREGVPVTPWHQRILRVSREKVARFPETERVQLEGGQVPPLGWKLVQSELGQTHEVIAAQGAEAFRSGPIAEAIVKTVREAGGVLSLEDLAGYRTVWRQPVRGTYRGYEVLSMPPPSSGGVHLVQMLNTLEPYDLAALGHNSSDAISLIAEAMKLAFADRAVHLGDPDFHAVPVVWLTSKEYGVRLAERIRPHPWWRRAPWTWGRSQLLDVQSPGEPPPNNSGTTHISTLDAEGNAVALSQSINTIFGSGLTVEGTGIVLNNHMDDFSLAPGVANAWGLVGTSPNLIAPGKRPLSSMTPTIVRREGRVTMVSGSPGGPVIISAVLQSLLNTIDYGLDAQEAVSAPRFHHQWRPDALVLEPEHPRDVVEALRRRGHPVRDAPYGLGAAQLIVRDPETGILWGGADPRRSSAASGY
jgi:gamma-glutamyltranspeptidase/glutathione hydrolase